MRRRRVWLLVGVLALAAAVSPAAYLIAVRQCATARDAAKAAIQGEWVMASLDDGPSGNLPSSFKQKVVGTRVAIQGDGVILVEGPPATFIKNLDPCRCPAEIDLVTDSSRYAGIYERDGKTFRLCLENYPGVGRPPKFQTDQSKWVIIVLKRNDHPAP